MQNMSDFIDQTLSTGFFSPLQLLLKTGGLGLDLAKNIIDDQAKTNYDCILDDIRGVKGEKSRCPK